MCSFLYPLLRINDLYNYQEFEYHNVKEITIQGIVKIKSYSQSLKIWLLRFYTKYCAFESELVKMHPFPKIIGKK